MNDSDMIDAIRGLGFDSATAICDTPGLISYVRLHTGEPEPQAPTETVSIKDDEGKTRHVKQEASGRVGVFGDHLISAPPEGLEETFETLSEIAEREGAHKVTVSVSDNNVSIEA